MKKKAVLPLLILLAGLCSCQPKTPKAIALKWLTNFYHLDYDADTSISTEDTKILLNEGKTQLLVQGEAADSLRKDFRKIFVKIDDKMDMYKDSAVGYYTITNNPNPHIIKLVRINGKWLVANTKEDYNINNTSETITDPMDEDVDGEDSTGNINSKNTPPQD